MAESLYNLTAQFVRGVGKTRLYAIGGFIQTLVLVALNIIFLLKFSLGITGYVFSLILSYLCVFLIYTVAGRTYKYIGSFDYKLLKLMLAYSLPMIPNGLSWWAMSYADKYVILVCSGAAANGIYLVSQKIPTVLTMFTTIFHQAWQISAVDEGSKSGKSDFSMMIYNNLQSAMFLCASFIICIVKPLYAIWVSSDYYEAWQSTPMLLLATVFSCLSQFLTVNYMVSKKTIGSLKVTLIGCLVNIILNILTIPRYGIVAAATATFIGYLSTYVVTLFDLRLFSYIPLKKTIGSTLICILQGCFLYLPTLYMVMAEIICMVVQLIMCRDALFSIVGIIKKICESIKHKLLV